MANWLLRCAQATPRVNVSAEVAKALTERIQDAGTEVVKAKARALIICLGTLANAFLV